MKNPKVVFITGGSGYIGSHLVYKLSELGAKTIIYDVRSPIIQNTLTHFIHGDIREKEKMKKTLQLWKPDAVVHLAAMTTVSDTQKIVNEQVEINVGGTENVLSAMHLAHIRHIIFASSAAVYGSTRGAHTEEKTLKPISVYGKTKKSAEERIEGHVQEGVVQAIILRLFNVAGSDLESRYFQKIKTHNTIFTNIIRSPLVGGRPLIVYGGNAISDHTPVRDYVSVQDVVDAIVRSISYVFEKNDSAVLNIGSGKGTSVLDVVQAMSRASGRMIPMRFVPRRPYEIYRSVSAVHSARRVLSWFPTQSNIERIARSVCKAYGI